MMMTMMMIVILMIENRIGLHEAGQGVSGEITLFL